MGFFESKLNSVGRSLDSSVETVADTARKTGEKLRETDFAGKLADVAGDMREAARDKFQTVESQWRGPGPKPFSDVDPAKVKTVSRLAVSGLVLAGCVGAFFWLKPVPEKQLTIDEITAMAALKAKMSVLPPPRQNEQPSAPARSAGAQQPQR